jgi:glyoxylase-like metal-dependent hydrolase (beta-lactamase superfamily II)
MGVDRRFGYKEVEGLRTGRFDLEVNTSAVLFRLGTTLIDAGPPNRWPQVRDFLRDRPPERVLLTHHHEDHSGNAARIASVFGAQVLAHPAALPELAKGWRLRPYQRLFWGRPPRLTAQPVPDVVELEHGLRLQTVSTPGHAEDLVCYLEKERGWLFTGDLYIGSRPRYLRQDENLPRQIESLRAILQHDFKVVFCSHRGVVTEGYRAIEEKLDYLLRFSQQVKELHGRGVSVREITRRLLGREDLTSLATLGHFTKLNMVRGCLADDAWA